MPFSKILKACQALFDNATITPEQVNKSRTENQRTIKMQTMHAWYEQKAGHITASIL